MHGKIQIYGAKISSTKEKTLLGKPFEKINQSRRIKILSILGWITDSQKMLFNQIREERNNYLHPWQEDNFKDEKEKALATYKNTCKLFREITGTKIKNSSSIEANPLLVQWMNNNLPNNKN